MARACSTPPPPQVHTRRREPRSGGHLKPLAENSDLEIAYRRTPDGDEFIGPNGETVTFNVITISPEELRSFERFRNVTLARSWPPVIVTREEWHSIRDEYRTLAPIEEGASVSTGYATLRAGIGLPNLLV